MMKTESFRLIVALAIVAGGAMALFFTFHSLAAHSSVQTEQSAIVLPAAQSGADGTMPDAQQSTSPADIHKTPVAPGSVPGVPVPGADHADLPSQPPHVSPTQGSGSTPASKQGGNPVSVVPAPPIDLDDPDDHDDLDDDPHDDDLNDKD